ncbi:MAG: hypothetical protein ACTHKP_05685 [Nitrososphaeraceae archaeon]|jgi:hypothetical protein
MAKIEIDAIGSSNILICKSCGFEIQTDDYQDASDMKDIHERIGCSAFNQRFRELTKE